MSNAPYRKDMQAPLGGGDTSVPLKHQKTAENVVFNYDRGFNGRPGSLPFFKPYDSNTNSLLPYSLLTGLDPITHAAAMYMHPYNGTAVKFLKTTIATVNQWYEIVPGSGTDTQFYINFYDATTGLLTATTMIGDPGNSLTWLSVTQLAALNPTIVTSVVGTAYPIVCGPTNGIVQSTSLVAWLPTFESAGWTGTGQPIPAFPPAQDNRAYSAASFQAPSGDIFRLQPGSCLMYNNGFREQRPGAWQWQGPTLPSVSTSLAAGSLTGNYQYGFTYYNVLQSNEVIEGDMSPVFSITLSSQKITGFPGPYLYSPADSSFMWPVEQSGNANLSGATMCAFASAPLFQVGEYIRIFFYNPATNAYEVYRRQVVAVFGGVYMQWDTALPLYAGGAVDFQVTNGPGVRIYRTKAGGTVFYYAGEVSPLTFWTGTVKDQVPDGSLGETYVSTPFTRYPAPAICYGLAYHQGRVCTLTTRAVRNISYNVYTHTTDSEITDLIPSINFTAAESLHYYPAENSVNLPVTKRSKPTGLVSISDVLYIFTDTNISYIQGTLSSTLIDTNPTYTVQLLSESVGCVAPNSLVKAADKIAFMSAFGPALLQGTQIDTDFSRPIQKELKQVCNDYTQAVFYYWEAKGILLCMVPKTVQTNLSDNWFDTDQNNTSPAFRPVTNETIIFAFDMRAQRWSRYTGLNAFGGMTELHDQLLFVGVSPPGSTVPYQINSMKDGCLDDASVPFTKRYTTHWEDDGNPSVWKRFPRAQIFSAESTDGQNFSLTVKAERNWQENIFTTNESISFLEGQGYGQPAWGSSQWGSPEIPDIVVPLSNEKAKSVRVTLENSLRENISVTAVSIEAAPVYDNMKGD